MSVSMDRVSSGEVDGDAFDEISASPGPGWGPDFGRRFRGFDYDGDVVAPLPM